VSDDGGGKIGSLIGYTLIVGVILTLLVEILGILLHFVQTNGFDFQFNSQWQMTGKNFFVYIGELVSSFSPFPGAIQVMGLGIVFLMLSSYIRVFTTVLYFGLKRNPKYSLIALSLLILLTGTLLLH
jgi:uncharacterized membrane protein